MLLGLAWSVPSDVVTSWRYYLSPNVYWYTMYIFCFLDAEEEEAQGMYPRLVHVEMVLYTLCVPTCDRVTSWSSVEYVQPCWGWTSKMVDPFFFHLKPMIHNVFTLWVWCDEGQDAYYKVLFAVVVFSREMCTYVSFSCCLRRIGSSLRPVWHFFILLKWPWNLSKIVLLVWPTYCLPHVLQLMQYTRLELLHVMFILHMNCFLVTWHVIVPLVFSSGQ